MTAAVIELRGVGKRYRHGAARSLRELATARREKAWHDVLQDVDLTVERGQVVALVGRNGGGKSTLLRIAAGVTRASSGTVLRRASVSGLLSLGSAASGELSARKNAVTTAVLAGLSPREARFRVGQFAEWAELTDVFDEPLRTFSDGMRVRLFFAAAVLTDPQLLLVDEVLAVGDLAFQQRCLEQITLLREGGCAVVVASHVLEHLRQVSTDAVWLLDGRVHRRGAPQEVLDEFARAMDAASGPAVPVVTDGGFRRGTGEVRLTSVVLRAQDESVVDRVPAGGGLRVEMHYERVAPLNAAQVSVSIRRRGDQATLVDLTSERSGAGPVRLGDTGTVVLDVNRLDLCPGQYWVDVGLHAVDWERSYDYRWNWVPLTVVGASTGGVLLPPHSWRSAFGQAADSENQTREAFDAVLGVPADSLRTDGAAEQ